MKDIFFFDSNCAVGLPMNGGVHAADAPALLSELDHAGVEKALVRFINTDIAISRSNASVAEFLREDTGKRLTGVWTILPSQCGELPEPDEFFAAFKANRIGAVTLYPVEHRYVPCRLTLGKILDAAAERKIPVLLNGFAGRWNDLYNFMKEFPRLTCIYLETCGKWGSDRNIRPLLENYEHFHFETAGYWVPGGIADLAEKYGAERIIYGSNFPRYNHGCGMYQLKYSGLSMEKIALIAGRNLENLLNEAQL